MAMRKSRTSARSKSARSGRSHRGLKTAALVAAAGVATYVAAKALKSPRGRTMRKKAVTGGRKVLAKARRATGRGAKGRRRTSAARSR